MEVRFLSKSAKSATAIIFLDAQPKNKDDKRIPLVLPYHPTLSKVYEILKESSKLLLVDDEHSESLMNT